MKETMIHTDSPGNNQNNQTNVDLETIPDSMPGDNLDFKAGTATKDSAVETITSSNGRNSPSVLFTAEHMQELLTAYHSFEEIQDILERLIGPDLYQGGAFEGLSHLDTLMTKLSPLYDSSKNYEDQVFTSVLEDRQLPVQEKARMLLSNK